jgi:hypothetical protein
VRIFKYPLTPPRAAISPFDVEMPKGAHVLSVGVQGDDEMVAWALVDPDAEKVVRRFAVYPTGLVEVSPHPGRFIGTVMFERGRLVFHVFDVGESPPAA